MILDRVDKFNDTIWYNTVQYGTVRYSTVRYQCNLIYVRFFTSNHEICAGRRPLPYGTSIVRYRTGRYGMVWYAVRYRSQFYLTWRNRMRVSNIRDRNNKREFDFGKFNTEASRRKILRTVPAETPSV